MSKELIRKEKLLFNLPITLEGRLGTIYQPKLKDFFLKDFQIERMYRTFNIDKNDVFEKDIDDIKNFDIFFILGNDINFSFLLKDLLISLSLIYKVELEDIKIFKNEKSSNLKDIYISISDKYVLDRDNYDYICKIMKIILDINENKKETKEEEEIFDIFEQRRREWEKQHQKKVEDKCNYDLMDFANYIIHVDDSNFDYQKVMDLTIYQLKNTFKLYQQKQNYKLNEKKIFNGCKDVDMTHWFFNK